MQRTLNGTDDAILHLAREVADLGEPLGFTQTRRYEVQTAVGEALSNAAVHGHGGKREDPIRLTAQVDDGHLLVEVRDRGKGLDRIPPLPDLERKIGGKDPPGGWGVFLMRSLASDVHFLVHADGGQTVRLQFEAEAPAVPVDPRITETPHG
jgi:anti-sigma regulatory factor (Ser/Thr protein kinase)